MEKHRPKIGYIAGAWDFVHSGHILAFKEAVQRAKLVLLEPIIRVEVVTPEDYMGNVVGDLNSKRAQIDEMVDRVNKIKVIHAKVPLAEMFGYATTLRSMSQGRASYTMEFLHYTAAPQHIVDKITGNVSGKK